MFEHEREIEHKPEGHGFSRAATSL